MADAAAVLPLMLMPVLADAGAWMLGWFDPAWLDVGVLAQTTGSTSAGGTGGATAGSTAAVPTVPVTPGAATGGQSALAGNAPIDFSITGMFLRADIVVQSVILVLALASFWCWAIIFEKLIHLRRVNSRSNRFEDSFWSGGSLEDLFDKMNNRPRDPMSAMFNAAMREWQRRPGSERKAGDLARGKLSERIDRVMTVTFGREVERLERNMTFLASVGSVAPFIGLFGTVWGIMNAFQAIAISKSTNLAAVAPGIAEALFATALGLVAAIPAVIAYNKLSNDVSRYANRLDAFSGEFSAILSRQLED